MIGILDYRPCGCCTTPTTFFKEPNDTPPIIIISNWIHWESTKLLPNNEYLEYS